MKEYITIKNFGPINSIERLNIKPYTVFIGESASGKSTIMKLVCMMRYLYKMANIRSYLKHSNITNSPFKIRFDKMMKEEEDIREHLKNIVPKIKEMSYKSIDYLEEIMGK